jgi:hypothetical protein
MRQRIVLLLLTVGVSACTSLTPDGARVKVYEADLSTPDAARALPGGCRLLSTTASVDQMESERHVSDPYRVQRNDTASRGGNILLVLSDRFVTRYKTDCASTDTSPDCQSRAQNWYKIAFASYACDPEAEQTLAAKAAETAASPSGGGWWPFGSRKASAPAASAPTSAPAPAVAARGGIAPSALKEKVLVLMREGVGTDVIVAFVESNRISSALTAEEILDWKKSGIAEPVIQAALSQAAPAR